MKKVIYIFFAGILTLNLWSCSEKIMDDINRDVNNPTDMESRLIVTDCMTSTAFSTLENDFTFYASVYIEHNVGAMGQLYNAEVRSAEPKASSTYNNTWVSTYLNLYNLKVIIDKCSAGGSEAGNYNTLGIAQILTAYNLATLTDMMGDVPWSEALKPGIIFTPVLDKQATIYDGVFNLLDDAIANLDQTSLFPSLGTQDLIYGGDTGKWKKFAYGLKARYSMRLSLKKPDYNNVITFANQSFTSASEQAQFNYNGNTTVSPFYRFSIDRNYFGASQSLHNKLVARNDPRDDVFFKPSPGTGSAIVFTPNGIPNQIQGFYAISAISTITAPTYLLSYHEIEFLKAEAYVRLNDPANAEVSLKNGIKAAFEKVNIGLTAAAADNYYDTNVKQKFTANPLSEVMNQKYLAFYEEESVEAYNDYRRLKAMGNNVIILENPQNTTLFPLRYSYGSSDVTANFNVRDAYGDGTYVYTENVWWAGGTR
jgi:hypothetical protein